MKLLLSEVFCFLFLIPFISTFSFQEPLGTPPEFEDVRFKNLEVPTSTSERFNARLVMYVQTFTTSDNKPISLLPLLEKKTRVTHVILASLHLHEEPGVMRLNNDPFDSPVYDKIWEEVKILQKKGVKVMALLGGAAAGSYMRLNGTDEEVCPHPLPKILPLRIALTQQISVLCILQPPTRSSPEIQSRRVRRRHRRKRLHLRPTPPNQRPAPRSRSLLSNHPRSPRLRPLRRLRPEPQRILLLRARLPRHSPWFRPQTHLMVQRDVLRRFRSRSSLFRECGEGGVGSE